MRKLKFQGPGESTYLRLHDEEVTFIKGEVVEVSDELAAAAMSLVKSGMKFSEIIEAKKGAVSLGD